MRPCAFSSNPQAPSCGCRRLLGRRAGAPRAAHRAQRPWRRQAGHHGADARRRLSRAGGAGRAAGRAPRRAAREAAGRERGVCDGRRSARGEPEHDLQAAAIWRRRRVAVRGVGRAGCRRGGAAHGAAGLLLLLLLLLLPAAGCWSCTQLLPGHQCTNCQMLWIVDWLPLRCTDLGPRWCLAVPTEACAMMPLRISDRAIHLRCRSTTWPAAAKRCSPQWRASTGADAPAWLA